MISANNCLNFLKGLTNCKTFVNKITKVYTKSLYQNHFKTISKQFNNHLMKNKDQNRIKRLYELQTIYEN